MSKSNELPSKRQVESVLPKTKANFTQIANDILLDQRLSFKARGILTLLLSRPKNWKIYIDEIVARSDVDGKHSIRTGFKELKDFGYLKLVKIWNDDTGKFEGTIYRLTIEPIPSPSLLREGSQTTDSESSKNQALSSDSPLLKERGRGRVQSDEPISRPTENLSVDKSDRLKTMTPSNTNSSNTKHSNIIIQQQQSKNDDGDFLKNKNIPVAAALAAVCKNITVDKTVVLKNITAAEAAATVEQTAAPLLPFLEKDEIWKKQFMGQDICKQIGTTEILTAPKFDLLLKHFGQTSISSGTTYANVVAIKRHFFNWFHANLKKNALVNYIEQQTKAPKKACKQAAALMPKTDAILNKIYGQQCDNEMHLYRCLQLLATHLAIYENALNYLDSDNQKAVKSWISDIEYAKNLVERGRKAGQLYWFCAKNPKQNPKQKRTKVESKTSIKSLMLNSFQHLPDSKFVV
ncbi:MAG: hypothetical protein AB8G11_11305 [Saprospiraceae bacterium]